MDRDPDTTIIVRYAMTMHDVEKERGVTAAIPPLDRVNRRGLHSKRLLSTNKHWYTDRVLIGGLHLQSKRGTSETLEPKGLTQRVFQIPEEDVFFVRLYKVLTPLLRGLSVAILRVMASKATTRAEGRQHSAHRYGVALAPTIGAGPDGPHLSGNLLVPEGPLPDTTSGGVMARASASTAEARGETRDNPVGVLRA